MAREVREQGRWVIPLTIFAQLIVLDIFHCRRKILGESPVTLTNPGRHIGD